MDDTIKQLLDSPNPDDRKKAIKSLAKVGDESALAYLAAMYKTERDPEVKELALQAGKYIRKQQDASKAEGRASNVVEEKAKVERVEVSALNEKRSFEMLDRAMNLMVSNDSAQSQELVRKAFSLNPNIRHDPYYMGIVGQAFDMHPKDAIAMLEAGDVPEKAKRGEPSKRGQDSVTWSDALVDLLVIALVVVGLVVTLNVLLPMALRSKGEQIMDLIRQQQDLSGMSNVELQQIETAFSFATADISQSIVTGIGTGFQAVMGLLLSYFFLNIVANSLMGGNGTLRALIHNTTTFQIVVNIFVYGLVGVFAYLWISALLDILLEMFRNPELAMSTEELNARIVATAPIGLAALAVMGLGAIVVTIWFSRLMGKTYQFGTSRGCATVILTNILAFALLCGCIALFGTAIAGVLGIAVATPSF